ncbi:MAG: hypothetical protein IJS84_09280 [Spirochaetales bacterium]|nr:hypothetical protein [Spirochaetales bacterium]
MTIYWCVEDERFCSEPVQGKTCLLLSDERIKALYSDCVPGRDRIVSGHDGYPVVQRIVQTEREVLIQERNNKRSWLLEHDYIGTKIATGRATIDDYAAEIRTMNEYAARIDEIDQLLCSGEGDENG